MPISNQMGQGDRMRHVAAEAWVVYLKPMKGSQDGIRSVCEQREWEAMEKDKPGYLTLIQSGIRNEGEAERLARGSSGESRPRSAKRTIPVFRGEAATQAEPNSHQLPQSEMWSSAVVGPEPAIDCFASELVEVPVGHATVHELCEADNVATKTHVARQEVPQVDPSH
jgi:hypothetical protein